MLRQTVLFIALCGLSLATVQAAPQHGKQYKDWVVACEQPEGAKLEYCYIFQNIELKTGEPLLQVAIGFLQQEQNKDKQPAAIFTVPLGVFLPNGVKLKVDDGQQVQIPIQRCTRGGCQAVVGLKNAMVQTMKKGRQAHLTFADATQREISVPISLIGFTAGYNALR